MNTKERAKAAAEWKTILKDHPAFARVFLSQQAILMDASKRGFKVVDQSMNLLVKAGLPVLFEDHWTKGHEQQVGELYLSDQVKCITALNRDPGRCFNLDPSDPPWFDDPFAGGRRMPPKPPIPPLRPDR